MNKEIVRGIDENLISLQMAKRPPLDDIEYRTIYSKKGWDMVHFKDNNGDYGMRIFFKKINIEKLEAKKFPEWSEIKIKPLIIKNNKRLCMDIRIINSMFLEPFDIFSRNIVSGADTCSSEPDLLNNIFMKCNQWKLFMRNKKVDKVKAFEQKGLIGELIFLELLMKEIGIKNSLESWKGQDKLSKDFLLSSVGIEVKAKIPPIEPSICNQIFFSLQISLISLIGSIAPLTVVPKVATIAKIFLFSIKHLSIVFLRFCISIQPLLSVLTLTRFSSSRHIILVHLTKEE